MMKIRLFIAFAAALMLTCSCKSQFELLLQSNDADAKYKAAFEYFDNEKYSKAASLFESLSMLTNGTERDDTVRYYWGLSNYRFKDYYTAETNFEQFIQSYPRSPFIKDATYLHIDCLYRSTLRYELDQTPTYKALNAISQYILEHPDSEHMEVCRDMLDDLGERLDKKAYEAAKLYYKMRIILHPVSLSEMCLRTILTTDTGRTYFIISPCHRTSMPTRVWLPSRRKDIFRSSMTIITS